MAEVHKDILEFLKNQKKVTVGFSTGKDSVAVTTILINAGIEVIPYFFYHIPDLDFVEENIRLYEKTFGFEVIRMPHPMLYDYLRHQDFQPPKMIDYLSEIEFPKMHFSDLVDIHLASIGDSNKYYDAVGERAAESFNRRMVFKTRGFINEAEKKFYPIADWKKDDVLSYLKKNNIPLTKDYGIWNRSFDGLKYQFLFGVKKNYPNDWKKILEYFPLIELELFRYEANLKYF